MILLFLKNLQEGMVLAKDVYKGDLLLLKKGYVLNRTMIERLKKHGVTCVFVEGVSEKTKNLKEYK